MARRELTEPTFSDLIELDLGEVVPSLAGPKRPQDRVSLSDAQGAFRGALAGYVPVQNGDDEAVADTFPASDPTATQEPRNGDGPRLQHAQASHTQPEQTSPAGAGQAERERAPTKVPVTLADGTHTTLDHGHVVIAAITSCTNTSNPSVMVGAGILARNALARGLKSKPWVKTSLAPGSKVVSEYLDRAGLTEPLEQLVSISSATAARPASAIPARCRRRSPRSSTTRTWRS